MRKLDLTLPRTGAALTQDLKHKSRQRRESLAVLSAATCAPQGRRNDISPVLEIVDLPLAELRLPGRKLRVSQPDHVREVAGSISALGFCVPVLVGGNNVIVDGAIRVEAARLLGLTHAPCLRVDHLSDAEQRTLRLAVNRLGEKGQWDLDALKTEFEELVLTDAPIEVVGFSPTEIDQIMLGDGADAIETGPLEPKTSASATARLGDVFRLGPHRVVCGSAIDPDAVRQLMEENERARLVLTDEPYNVPIAGHVSGSGHREFAMASGEMSDAEFLDFNAAWMGTMLPLLCEGGIFGTFEVVPETRTGS